MLSLIVMVFFIYGHNNLLVYNANTLYVGNFFVTEAVDFTGQLLVFWYIGYFSLLFFFIISIQNAKYVISKDHI